MDYLEKIFLEIISKFKIEDLQYAIKNDVDLAQLMVKEIPTIIRAVRAFAHFYNNNQTDLITDYNIINYLNENKPDFARILIKPEGRKWLNKNISNIKRLFFG